MGQTLAPDPNFLVQLATRDDHAGGLGRKSGAKQVAPLLHHFQHVGLFVAGNHYHGDWREIPVWKLTKRSKLPHVRELVLHKCGVVGSHGSLVLVCAARHDQGLEICALYELPEVQNQVLLLDLIFVFHGSFNICFGC